MGLVVVGIGIYVILCVVVYLGQSHKANDSRQALGENPELWMQLKEMEHQK